jgi:pimeloyl-ACP methyl ester carboxylesterase
MRSRSAELAERANEPAALGELAGRGFGEGVRRVEEMHQAIARRAFAATGDSLARVLHDGIARISYGWVRKAGEAAGALAAAYLRLRPPAGADGVVSGSRAGGLALAALNGLVGDRLEREHEELSTRMTLRHGGRELPLSREHLSEAYPRASGELVVFVHGLCESEAAWWLGAERLWADPGSSHGSRLQAELGVAPLYVRYNTGLHTSENGARLATLLERLVDAWPVDVDELTLVGHSMGGLVIRSACQLAEREGQAWTAALRRCVYLGAPHLGAPLEKAANVAAWGLAGLPETRPIAKILNARSAGIKDLRYGALVEDDWCKRDPDALLTDSCGDVPLIETADHYCLCATVTRDPGAPLGRVLGDLLVLYPSSSGRGGRRGRRIPFGEQNGRHVGPATHFHLLNHPLVYEQLRTWIGSCRIDEEVRGG